MLSSIKKYFPIYSLLTMYYIFGYIVIHLFDQIYPHGIFEYEINNELVQSKFILEIALYIFAAILYVLVATLLFKFMLSKPNIFHITFYRHHKEEINEMPVSSSWKNAFSNATNFITTFLIYLITIEFILSMLAIPLVYQLLSSPEGLTLFANASEETIKLDALYIIFIAVINIFACKRMFTRRVYKIASLPENMQQF